MPEIEKHPWKPFLPEGGRLLMLGSFPPQPKRWSMEFYYPNRSNMMWEVMGSVFYGDSGRLLSDDGKGFNLAEIKQLLSDKGIGMYDTATAVRRLADNASDKELEVVERTDIAELLRSMPGCHDIACTGTKSAEEVCEEYGLAVPKMGEHCEGSIGNRQVRIWRMPSTSRAYPMALPRKAEYYLRLMSAVGIL